MPCRVITATPVAGHECSPLAVWRQSLLTYRCPPRPAVQTHACCLCGLSNGPSPGQTCHILATRCKMPPLHRYVPTQFKFQFKVQGLERGASQKRQATVGATVCAYMHSFVAMLPANSYFYGCQPMHLAQLAALQLPSNVYPLPAPTTSIDVLQQVLDRSALDLASSLSRPADCATVTARLNDLQREVHKQHNKLAQLAASNRYVHLVQHVWALSKA